MKKENKQTFTYATRPSVKAKAMKKAAKERLSLSEKIDQMLCEYVRPKPEAVKDIFKVRVVNDDGSVTPLNPLKPW